MHGSGGFNRTTADPDGWQVTEQRQIWRARLFCDAGLRSQVGSAAGVSSSAQVWAELDEKGLRLAGLRLTKKLESETVAGSHCFGRSREVVYRAWPRIN
jgi:hypothetical protein